VPGARLQIFADSGHVPHLEEPGAVADAIVAFCGGDGGPQLRGPHVQGGAAR